MIFGDRSDRIGTFEIPLNLIRYRPQDVLEIMSKVIIVRAECMHNKMCIRYDAISNHFRKVKDREEIPEYIYRFDFGEVYFIEKTEAPADEESVGAIQRLLSFLRRVFKKCKN